MKVEIGCPACGKKHDINSNLVGQSLTCNCGNKFVAQLPPPKVAQPTSAEVEPSPPLPVVEQEVHINSRIRMWFWIGIVGLIVLFVIWWNSGRPLHPPTPPAAVSIL